MSHKLQKLEATAYHEAGHAVGRWVQRVPFRYVTIIPEPDDGSLGHVLGYGLPAWMDYEKTSSLRLALMNWIFMRGMKQILRLLSGPAAETKYRGRHNRVGAGRDKRIAAEMAYALCGNNEKEAVNLLRFLNARAEALINIWWWAVNAVAKELLARDRLSHSEVTKAIQGTDPAVKS